MHTCHIVRACSGLVSDFSDPNLNHENNVKCTWFVIPKWDTKYAFCEVYRKFQVITTTLYTDKLRD